MPKERKGRPLSETEQEWVLAELEDAQIRFQQLQKKVPTSAKEAHEIIDTALDSLDSQLLKFRGIVRG